MWLLDIFKNSTVKVKFHKLQDFEFAKWYDIKIKVKGGMMSPHSSGWIKFTKSPEWKLKNAIKGNE